MRINCRSCKQEAEVIMYFYNTEILTRDDYSELGKKIYIASVDGKAICPLCGKEIREIFHTRITDDDILWLATGERR
jgi:hypothetical protein